MKLVLRTAFRTPPLPIPAFLSRHKGLECRSRPDPVRLTRAEVDQASPARHVQLISPGRSGSRWLANLLVETTDAYVCHATPTTLARAGYAYHHHRISEQRALCLYRRSRARFLAMAQRDDRHFIDLDCKVTPLVPVLARHYPHCKFVIALRDPVSFVKSGVRRGYFLNKSPRAWGHLEDHAIDQSRPLLEWQIYKIASFWNSVARLAQECFVADPHRTHVLPCPAMFADPHCIAECLDWLELDHAPLAGSQAFHAVANANRGAAPLSEAQVSLLRSAELSAFSLAGLSDDFLQRCGLR